MSEWVKIISDEVCNLITLTRILLFWNLVLTIGFLWLLAVKAK